MGSFKTPRESVSFVETSVLLDLGLRILHSTNLENINYPWDFEALKKAFQRVCCISDI